MLTDPLADLFTRIRNATKVQKPNCVVSFSRKKWMVLTLLKQQGYINDFQKIKLFKNQFNHIDIKLKYYQQQSVIRHLESVSKPGLKLYVRARAVPVVCNGLGIAILSTSSGLLTDAAARSRKIGGKVLAYVW